MLSTSAATRTRDLRFRRPLLYPTELLRLVVPQGRLQLPTYGLGNRRSVQLSYQGISGGERTRTAVQTTQQTAFYMLSFIFPSSEAMVRNSPIDRHITHLS